MSNPSNDRPRVIIFPPVIPISTIALSFLLQWLIPLGLLNGIDPRWRIGVGIAIFTVGVLLCLIARTSLVRRGTNVNPLQPTMALATDGIYGWTRNPIYVRGTFRMIGVGFVFALDWLWPLLVPSLLTLHLGVVRRAERYLEDKFADAHRGYQARVPRYLGVQAGVDWTRRAVASGARRPIAASSELNTLL